jgi:hypothetical protein
MHYCDAHTLLLPDQAVPLPMPDTRLDHLWLLAALNVRRRLLPVPHGPLTGRKQNGQ